MNFKDLLVKVFIGDKKAKKEASSPDSIYSEGKDDAGLTVSVFKDQDSMED